MCVCTGRHTQKTKRKNRHTLPGAEAFQSMGCVSGVAESSSFHILIVLSACTITNEQESISAKSLLQHCIVNIYSFFFGHILVVFRIDRPTKHNNIQYTPPCTHTNTHTPQRSQAWCLSCQTDKQRYPLQTRVSLHKCCKSAAREQQA